MVANAGYGKPVIAKVENPQAVIQQIDKTLTPQQPSWDQQIAEQLKLRDEQIAQQQAALEAQEAERQAQIVPVMVQAPAGTCGGWMVAAGITDMPSAYQLLLRESGCNPNAVNRSSGACGLGQQLPCGKWPHQWNDPVGGLIDMQNYVLTRYGSWANALGFHYANNWY